MIPLRSIARRMLPFLSLYISSFLAMALLAMSSAHALDPRATDIIALRLGMVEANVTARLAEQGFDGPAFRRDHQPCRLDASRRCLIAISTRTLDGWISVTFDRASIDEPDRVVTIAYWLDAKRSGEAEAITVSLLERYGPPDIANPMTWCDRPTGIGPCSVNRANMILQTSNGNAMLLRMTEKSPTPQSQAPARGPIR